jgi:hypothetical protein
MRFQKTLEKKDISAFLDRSSWEKTEVVRKIQDLKENTLKRLMDTLWWEKQKFIDPLLVKGVESDYFDVLKKVQGSIDPQFNFDDTRKDIECMFKKEQFGENYIAQFKHGAYSKYLETPSPQLFQRKAQINQKRFLSPNDKDELAALDQALHLLDTNAIKNTRSRTILFDKQSFHDAQDAFNVECFFEQDQKWNRNYFSINQLLNDLETFGVESGYPVLDIHTAAELPKGFGNIQKFIKLALVKNILAKYRDYQEIMMYNFVDYEKQDISHDQKTGVLAEKVVEWVFRNFAHLEDKYIVKISKASVGEDQDHKVDLIIQLKDKTTWISILKELQLTINHNKDVLMHKRNQIARQQFQRGNDMDLLELEMNLLGQKITLRRNLQRPIWWIDKLLSLDDKAFLKKTFDRIVDQLEAKKNENIRSGL